MSAIKRLKKKLKINIYFFIFHYIFFFLETKRAKTKTPDKITQTKPILSLDGLEIFLS